MMAFFEYLFRLFLSPVGLVGLAALDSSMQSLSNRAEQLRRLPIGAELLSDGVHFRVWAPNAETVDVVIEGAGASTYKLNSEGKGYFSGRIQSALAGTRYRFRLDQGGTLYPDLASRFQPDGPHGASAIVDPLAFHWTDDAWRGVSLKGQVIYEMHIGAFTHEYWMVSLALNYERFPANNSSIDTQTFGATRR